MNPIPKIDQNSLFLLSSALFQVFRRVTECIDDHKSKDETASYLLDKFQIESPMTNIGKYIPFHRITFNGSDATPSVNWIFFFFVVWGSLERTFPASFVADNIQGDASSTQNRKPNFTWHTSFSIMIKSKLAFVSLLVAHTQNAQRDASSSSSHVPHESATRNALVPVQQPLSLPLFFLCFHCALLNLKQTFVFFYCLFASLETENLKEMLSRLDQIKSIQDMLKVMIDGNAFGQRVENEPVRGNNRDAENLTLWLSWILNILCLFASICRRFTAAGFEYFVLDSEYYRTDSQTTDWWSWIWTTSFCCGILQETASWEGRRERWQASGERGRWWWRSRVPA